MKGQGSILGKKIKTVQTLLSEGFKQSHIFLKALGDTNDIKLKKSKLKTLKSAIEKKDYYEIKAIIFSTSTSYYT